MRRKATTRAVMPEAQAMATVAAVPSPVLAKAASCLVAAAVVATVVLVVPPLPLEVPLPSSFLGSNFFGTTVSDCSISLVATSSEKGRGSDALSRLQLPGGNAVALGLIENYTSTSRHELAASNVHPSIAHATPGGPQIGLT